MGSSSGWLSGRHISPFCGSSKGVSGGALDWALGFGLTSGLASGPQNCNQNRPGFWSQHKIRLGRRRADHWRALRSRVQRKASIWDWSQNKRVWGEIRDCICNQRPRLNTDCRVSGSRVMMTIESVTQEPLHFQTVVDWELIGSTYTGFIASES